MAMVMWNADGGINGEGKDGVKRTIAAKAMVTMVAGHGNGNGTLVVTVRVTATSER